MGTVINITRRLEHIERRLPTGEERIPLHLLTDAQLLELIGMSERCNGDPSKLSDEELAEVAGLAEVLQAE